MTPYVALAACLLILAFLFYRDIKLHPALSGALWIPIVSLFILGSRSVSAWLGLGTSGTVELDAYQEGSSLDRNFLIILIFFSVVVLIRRKIAWGVIFRRNRVLLCFLLFCLVSIIWSEFPLVAFKRFIKFAGSVTIIMIILSENSPSEAAIAVLRRISYLIICLSVLFIRYFPEYGRYYHIWTHEVRYSGACSYKNELGIACIIAVIVFLWELIREFDKKPKPFSSVETWTILMMLAMTVYLLKIANSASATFCILIGVLLILGTTLPLAKRRRATITKWISGVVLASVLLQAAFNIKDKIIIALGRSPSLTERVPLWNTLLGMPGNPLLGTGFESFWTIDRLTYIWGLGYTALQAHNGYIDTYLNLGLVGVAFFLAIILTYFKNTGREFLNDYAFGQLKLAFFIIFILYNFTEAAFPRLSLLLMVFFLFMIEVPRSSSHVIGDIAMDSKGFTAVDPGFSTPDTPPPLRLKAGPHP